MSEFSAAVSAGVAPKACDSSPIAITIATPLRYAVVMAQEPENTSAQGDASHELDLATLWSSSNHDAEMEAMQIHGLMQANGIPSILVGPSTIPVLEFQVRVPVDIIGDAQRILEEARAAGPAAAEEAQRLGESEGAV